MRNVTIVVLVLITSYHVSENLKIGPVAAQTTMTANAIMNAAEEPVARVTPVENRSKKPRL